jgi:tetratricopeptide (TPR) repeat protein
MENKHVRILTLTLIVALLAVTAVQADLDQAMNYFKAGKYMEAASEFQAMVDAAPNYDFGYFMLGYSFLAMQNTSDAQTNLLKAIDLNGDKYEYHQALAQAYTMSKDYPKTIATLKTAEDLATTPAFKYALYELRGAAYLGEEKWSDAINDLEKARAINASPAIARYLADAYFNLEHMDKALPFLREVLKSSPTDTTVLRKMTRALLDLGAETRDAAQKNRYYSEALKTAKLHEAQMPNSAMAANYRGRAALGAKEFEEAVASFRHVLAIDASHCYAMTNLGKTYIALKHWTDAETTLKDAGKCDPRSSVIFESLGFALQKQKKLQEAIDAYKKSLAIKPSTTVSAAIKIAEENIQTRDHNLEMDQLAAKQTQELADEQARVAAEKAKVDKWNREHEMDEAEDDQAEEEDEKGEEGGNK